MIPFSPPDISDDDIEAVVRVLRSGWITTGPAAERFETALATYCGTPDVKVLNSGTAALEAALRILGIGPGDEVLAPVYTYAATINAIAHVGATPVLVDCSPGSYVPDVNQYLTAITDRTKAVITVDVGGAPYPWPEMLEALAQRRVFEPSSEAQANLGRIAYISDSAHSLGATRGTYWAGQVPDFTAFSFHAVKNLTTAEGGALTWSRSVADALPQLRRRLDQLALHGQTKSALMKSRAGDWEYDITEPGYKWNMPDILAALGHSQLSRYESVLARRRALTTLYEQLLQKLPVTALRHVADDYKSSAHLMMIRLSASAPDRNIVIRRLAEHGVSANVHYKPITSLKAYSALGQPQQFANAYAAYEREVSLPLHTRLSEADVSFVADALERSLK